MKALILVAGHGSRLRPAIGDTPKSLVEVGGMALLDRQIETMTSLGIERICLATGYRHPVFEERYGDRVDYRYNPFFKDSNNIISFLFARDWVANSDLVVCYGDLLYEPGVLRAAMAAPAAIGLAVDRSKVEDGHALVRVQEGKIAQVGRSVAAASADARFIGLARYSREGLAQLLPAMETAVQNGKRDEYYIAGVQALIDEGYRAEPIDVTGHRWMELDFPEDLEAATREWG